MIKVSPNDNKSYAWFELENGIRVLLVEDFDTDKSAAALAVNVGHFDDPVEHQGLAHLLEHMLFLGTEKYPNPGEYQQFITTHGGHNNAWTGTEHTSFFFDIDNEFFFEALDRFAQFFIAPLFNAELVQKERQAVDAEYKLKLKDELRRQYQVHKETANPAHPFTKFSTGNIETLSDTETTSIRQVLLDFYNDQYCSRRMTLCIESNEPIEVIKPRIAELFSQVKDRGLSAKQLTIPLYRAEQLQLQIQLNPIREQRKLYLAFALPGINAFYRNKPLSYLAHLIGYEGPGSLLSSLKRKGWVLALSAGSGVSGSNYKDFSIICSLTVAGAEHVDEIVEEMFQFLNLIRQQGIEQWRYEEKKQVMEQAFRFKEPARAIDNVSHLVQNLQHYHRDHVIYGDYMMNHFDDELIREYLDQMDVDNMRLMLVTPEVETDQVANWYSTPYGFEKISAERLARWKHSGINPEHQLAPRNPYLTDQLDAQPIVQQSELPEQILDKSGIRLWYLQDKTFRVPKGSLFFSLESEVAVSSPRNVVLCRLMLECFLDHLNETTYQAEVAGLSYHLYPHQGGLSIQIGGFSGKQFELLRTVLRNRLFGRVDAERFATVRRQLKRYWANMLHAKPISQLFRELNSVLQPANHHPEVLLQELEDIDQDELPRFAEQMYREVHVEGLAHGDWTPEQVQELTGILEAEILETATHSNDETQRCMLNIKDLGTLHRSIECEHADSGIVVYYQSHETDDRSVATYLLAQHLLSSLFYNQLRTEQQLGYVVGTTLMPLFNHAGILLYIQSPKCAPAELLERIDAFLAQLPEALAQISEEELQHGRNGVITKLEEEETNLKARSQRLWSALSNKDFQFDRRSRVASEVAKIDRDSLADLCVQMGPTSDRLVVSCQGQAHTDLPPLELPTVATVGEYREQDRYFRFR